MSDKDTDRCPMCGGHVYRGSYNGTPVYKCAIPIRTCEWNREWHEQKGGDEYRMPLGKTKAQVRRVFREFKQIHE